MERIGQYEVLVELGAGGMAQVLLGRTTGAGGFEKLVAIKRILPHMTEDENFVKMFIDEATISAKLNHSSIGQIFEFGKAGDCYFIAMEFIQGVDLRSIHKAFRKKGITPMPEMAAYIIMNVCAALDYAHRMTDDQGRPLNIIHRDLSPSNVLISYEGQAKLIDFGIAKAAQRLYVTVGANLKGKFAYMSPEQAGGRSLDNRSDIFGAGTLLFELLTGRNPFRAATDMETLQRVQGARVPNPSRVVPDIPPELDSICMKALSLNPDDRFATAAEMQEALETYSRRTAFGSRRMSRWMKETFKEEIAKWQEVIRASRAQAGQAQSGAAANTGLAATLDGGGQAQVIDLKPKDQSGVAPMPRPGTPSGVAPMPRPGTPSGVAPMPRPGTPSGVAPMPQPGAPVGPAQIGSPAFARQDNSERMGVGRVASPNTDGAHEMNMPHRPYSRSGRTRTTTHVLVFSFILTTLGAGAYLLLGKSGKLPEISPSPQSSVKIILEPALLAQVFVDDDLHGSIKPGVPYIITGLLPGKHRIRLEGETFKELENVVTVYKGKTTDLYLRVEPQDRGADSGLDRGNLPGKKPAGRKRRKK